MTESVLELKNSFFIEGPFTESYSAAPDDSDFKMSFFTVVLVSRQTATGVWRPESYDRVPHD